MKTIKTAIPIIIVIGMLALIDTGASVMALFAVLLILSALYIIQRIKSEIMTEQRELVFHDTVPLPLEQLEKGRKKAIRQQDKILTIFRSNPNRSFTPYQIQEIYQMVYGENILITSVRRSITDLTNEGTGRLRKGEYGDQVKEKWNTNNNRWHFNPDFKPKLNK
jgi:uncharacterized membrane protein YhiD involved in acid resistance